MIGDARAAAGGDISSEEDGEGGGVWIKSMFSLESLCGLNLRNFWKL